MNQQAAEEEGRRSEAANREAVGHARLGQCEERRYLPADSRHHQPEGLLQQLENARAALQRDNARKQQASRHPLMAAALLRPVQNRVLLAVIMSNMVLTQKLAGEGSGDAGAREAQECLRDRQSVYIEKARVNTNLFALKVKAKKQEMKKQLGETSIWKWLDSNPNVIEHLCNAARLSVSAPRERFTPLADASVPGGKDGRGDMAAMARANLKVDEIARSMKRIKQLVADLAKERDRLAELELQRTAEREATALGGVRD